MIKAGRQMATSRIASGKEDLVRTAPRRAFQPEISMLVAGSGAEQDGGFV